MSKAGKLVFSDNSDFQLPVPFPKVPFMFWRNADHGIQRATSFAYPRAGVVLEHGAVGD
jgi:hypothetical protein